MGFKFIGIKCKIIKVGLCVVVIYVKVLCKLLVVIGCELFLERCVEVVGIVVYGGWKCKFVIVVV